MHNIDFEAERFGLEVFAALGLDGQCEPTSLEGRREWKSFANWMTKKMKNQTPAVERPALWERGLARARYIRDHGRSSERPGAVWHAVMSGKRKAVG